MRPKIDVMEREWKNLEFGGNLNKASIRILDFWKFKGIASSGIAFSQHTLNQLKRIHAYAKAVAFPLVF